jgi:bacillithiol biosynthesis deacetylase BshB1
MPNDPALDVLVLATHPDDAESTCGGTIAKLVSRGARVGVLDVSRGEMGTRGTPESRALECAAASKILGLCFRENLGLPDGRVSATVEAREEIARWLRRLRPAILIAPWWEHDLHPDHAAVGAMARQAYFLAGLRRLVEDLPPHRPRRVLYYPSHDLFEPSFVVELEAAHFEKKLDALRAYASQVFPNSAADRGQHFVHGQEMLDRIEVRARFFGSRIGVRFGEPFRAEGTLSDVDPLGFAAPAAVAAKAPKSQRSSTH